MFYIEYIINNLKLFSADRKRRNVCDENAEMNDAGECECNDGYSGDGIECTGNYLLFLN